MRTLMLLVVAVLAVSATASRADSISIMLTAEVTDVDDPENILGGVLAVADIITGVYVYDTNTPDTNALPTGGDYLHTTAPNGITINAGGLVFRTDPDNVSFLVEIVNNHGAISRDNYLLRSHNNLPLANGAAVEHISWQLDDLTGGAVSSIALPTEPPVLADWTQVVGMGLEGCIILPTEDECTSRADSFAILAIVTSVAFGADADHDGVPDDQDNCPDTYNPGQENRDGDAHGDACDACPDDNPDDTDGDGACDSNEYCPNDPGKTGPGSCGCGTPDDDTDGDGVPDCDDNCPNDPNKTTPGTCGCGAADDDSDGDLVIDCVDNCPNVPNRDQADADGNGVGDACELSPAGQSGTCGCGAGSALLVPLMLTAMGWMRRRKPIRRTTAGNAG